VNSKRACYAGLAVFAVLSVTDYVQTYVLVQTTGGRVYESNPVAGAWLARYGWVGLAAFKAGAVAVVVGSVALLAARRPGAGAGVAVTACLALLWVTLYSRQLMAQTPAAGDSPVSVEALSEW